VKTNVYACLLAGGKGTRLWPLSTEKHPKSFVRIANRKPLLEECIGRLAGLAEKNKIIIVIDKAQAGLVRGVATGIPGKNILVEPFGRSTAAAIGLAAIQLCPEDILIALPTDSIIKDLRSFRKAMKSAINFVERREDILLCVGVTPNEPKASYGYIKVDSRQKGNVYSIDRFIEKPDVQTAKKFVKNPNYLWNVGIFVFRAGSILRAMSKHSPALYRGLMRIKKDGRKKDAAYRRMKNVSVDYQIMEKAKNLYCAKGNFSWCDIGNWKSASQLFKKDKRGNRVFGNARLVNTRDSVIYNATKQKLGVTGVSDCIVACTNDGTLVCSKKDAERVKELATGV